MCDKLRVDLVTKNHEDLTCGIVEVGSIDREVAEREARHDADGVGDGNWVRRVASDGCREQ